MLFKICTPQGEGAVEGSRARETARGRPVRYCSGGYRTQSHGTTGTARTSVQPATSQQHSSTSATLYRYVCLKSSRLSAVHVSNSAGFNARGVAQCGALGWEGLEQLAVAK